MWKNFKSKEKLKHTKKKKNTFKAKSIKSEIW